MGLIDRLQIRCLPPKASQEDGNLTTRQIHMHILREDHGEEAFGWDLELQGVQQDHGRRRLHSVVSIAYSRPLVEGESYRQAQETDEPRSTEPQQLLPPGPRYDG